jgi:hypothetical protein
MECAEFLFDLVVGLIYELFLAWVTDAKRKEHKTFRTV